MLPTITEICSAPLVPRARTINCVLPVLPEEELLDDELELLDELLDEELLDEELLDEELLLVVLPLEASENACMAAAGRRVVGFQAPRV